MGLSNTFLNYDYVLKKREQKKLMIKIVKRTFTLATLIIVLFTFLLQTRGFMVGQKLG
jgi:hypothetical protein